VTTPAPWRRPTPCGWAVPRGLARRRRSPVAGLVLLIALLAAACDPGPAEIAGVSIEVPDGWQRIDTPPDREVHETAVWRGGRADASSLQVVVGCGDGTVAELASAAVTGDRPPLTVTGAEVDTDIEVPGADAAIALELTFGAGRADDASTLVVRGIYAEVADALVLIELSTPVRDADAAFVAATLASIDLDRATLDAACPESG